MRKKEGNYESRARGKSRSFRRRCIILVKEKKARFYILRRCVIMLVCWSEP
ncbi:DVL protein [Dioscorea alata]|uniref:DVL protein n=1 Tax=Dioscorea alata TaxID=55571 RepID=A0ACB7WU34_DIOAL|nr:DVL protein [Dioscorea alata]